MHTVIRTGKYLWAWGMLMLLGACLQPQSDHLERSESALRPNGAERVAQIEDPKLWSRTEPGLWDGRPSLGGIWVAHPDAREPRHVRISNAATGKTVDGALFRRERALPGVKMQVSSDAAAALGLLAGMPAPLAVVALAPAPTANASAAKAPPALPDTTKSGPPAQVSPTPKSTAKPESRSTPPPAAQGAKVAASAPAPKAANTGTIRVGTFSVKANAEQAVRRLSADGMEPALENHVAGTKSYWTVTVARSNSAEEGELLLKKVRGLGYADAYAVRK